MKRTSEKKKPPTKVDKFESFILNAISSVTKNEAAKQTAEFQSDVRAAKKRLTFESDKSQGENSDISSMTHLKNYSQYTSNNTSRLEQEQERSEVQFRIEEPTFSKEVTPE